MYVYTVTGYCLLIYTVLVQTKWLLWHWFTAEVPILRPWKLLPKDQDWRHQKLQLEWQTKVVKGNGRVSCQGQFEATLLNRIWDMSGYGMQIGHVQWCYHLEAGCQKDTCHCSVSLFLYSASHNAMIDTNLYKSHISWTVQGGLPFYFIVER